MGYKRQNLKILAQIIGDKMLVVGSISSEEEKQEILYIAKIFAVGQRAQVLSRQARRKNENNNKKKNK